MRNIDYEKAYKELLILTKRFSEVDTVYDGEDDDCGHCPFCDKVSYNEHSDSCPQLKLKEHLEQYSSLS